MSEVSVGNDLLPHADTFAQVAQVPPHLPRRLRKLRKFRGIFRDVCAGCASTTAFAETFAQAAQVARHLPRRLRRLRKSRRIYRGVCGSPASVTENFLAFATLLQAFPKAFWLSRGFRKESLLILCLHRTHIKYHPNIISE